MVKVFSRNAQVYNCVLLSFILILLKERLNFCWNFTGIIWLYSSLYLDYLNLCWLFKGHHLIQPDSLYRDCLCFSLVSLKSDSFSNRNQSIVPCLVLTISSWPAYRFLTRQVRRLVFPFVEEYSTVCCDPHSQRL